MYVTNNDYSLQFNSLSFASGLSGILPSVTLSNVEAAASNNEL